MFRFMLGLGEAGGYTASPKVVSEWFPARDRGIAVGLYSVGGALGAVIALLLVLGIAGHFSDTTFKPGSFKDAPALATKISQSADPVSAFLHERLSPETRSQLAAKASGESEQKQLKASLARELNLVINDGSIYEAGRFTGVTNRRPETVKLLARNPECADLVKLNRLLLEDAYPREISIYVGWRYVFIITPLFGLTFVVLWLWLYRKPEEHKWLTEEERALILKERKQDDAGLVVLNWRVRWGGILSSPAVWALMFARLLTDPVWYFLNFWLPKYMSTERHLEQSQLAWIWTVYLAADIGFLAAGFISGWFVRRGTEAMASRRRVLLAAACIVPLAPMVTLSPGIVGSFAFAALIALAHTAWLASISTYIVDLVPKQILATAFGFIAAGSAFGGIMMNEAVGWAVTHYSYRPCFFAMVILHPLAFLLIWLFARKPWTAKTITPAAA
jgi:sugar phosphate permease